MLSPEPRFADASDASACSLKPKLAFATTPARLLLLAALLLVLIATTVHASTAPWRTRPGTIAHALAQPDGSAVSLDTVLIAKIKSSREPVAYFVVRESMNAIDRIVIITPPAYQLRLGMSVDVAGTVTTLQNGHRAIAGCTVHGYLDRAGNLLRHAPILKGYLAPTPWPWKIDLTVASTADPSVAESIPPGTLPGGLASAPPDEPNPDPAAPPTYYPTIAAILDADTAQPQGATVQSGIPDVQGLPDGSLVELSAKRIIGVGVETIESVNYKYVDIAEDLPATDSIRTYYTADVPETSRVNMITGQIRHVGTIPVIDVDTGPGGYDPQILEGQLQAAAQGTIAWAKTFQDGTSLPIQYPLTGKIVSRTFPSAPSPYGPCFYIQEQNRTAGIRVNAASPPNPGGTVTITGGTMTTVNGERVIDNPTSVEQTGTYTVYPLGMNHKLLGGGRLNQYTPAVGYAYGVSNTGTLVRVFGKVKSVGTDCFYLEDGSGVNSTEGTATGLKISWAWHGVQDGDPPIVAPAVDWWVYADGVSGAEGSSEPYLRVVRLRKQDDLRPIVPADATPPTIAITMPPDGEIHKATSQTTVRLAGTASDVGTVVTSVQVKVMTGLNAPKPARPWPNATGTTSWYYDWTGVQAGDYTIWASATDFAGNVTETPRNVTVINVDVVYVSQSGNDTTGNSWANAKRTVTAGMDLASDGKEVWVAAGTGPYIETSTVQLKSGVALYGGFAGTETAREQRNWALNKTILDGANAQTVVSATDLTSSATIDGFTIQHGFTGNYGGGIFCYNSTCVIRHNTITGCVAYGGGGIYCENCPLVTVSNNIIIGNTGDFDAVGGIYIVYSGGDIANNTVARNNGDGIAISTYSDLNVCNNIVARNTWYGISLYGSNMPDFAKNDVYDNDGGQYNWTPAPPGDINPVDPIFVDLDNGDARIFWTSPCRDAGDNSVLPTETFDINAAPRRNGNIDIGAHETSECWRYRLTLSSQGPASPIDTPLTLTAEVVDVVTGQSAIGCRVDVSVDAGEIRSVTRDGDTVTLPSGTQSTYGTTGTDGIVTASVVRQDQGWLHADGAIASCGLPVTKTAVIWFDDPADHEVGFLYDLCLESLPPLPPPPPIRSWVHQYLTRIDLEDASITYRTITGDPFTIDASFDVVFLVLPTRDLLPSELSSLSTFVQSGREKRIVLVGEYGYFSSYYQGLNNKLNDVAAYLGVNARLSTSGDAAAYDSLMDRGRLCTVSSTHYLMAGVASLWDAATSTFQDGWQAYAEPLAYINAAPTLPWIIEEDTPTAGSRVLIHDASIMLPGYNYDDDTIPDKNFKFIRNLCTVFPQ